MAAILVKCVGINIIFFAIICSVATSDKDCPGSSPSQEAMKLIPCLPAIQNTTANVPPDCCSAVRSLLKSPRCMCAVLLSKLAKSTGINVTEALTIPVRCDIDKHVRHSGEKCGDYIVP